MRLYIYEAPSGLIGDFRPYLDGLDHAHEPPRQLGGYDPRWEKVQTLTCPRTDETLFGKVKFVGRATMDDYHELVMFPIAWDGDYEAESKGEEQEAAAEDEAAAN